MGGVLKFLKLPLGDKCLLILTFNVVLIVRLMLWLLPFRHFRALVDKSTPAFTPKDERDSERMLRIAWAVTQTARPIPGATCFTQAIATKILMSWWRYPCVIQIGVMKDEEGALKSHAWVEVDDKVLIGGSEDLAAFIPIVALDHKNSTSTRESM